jgi:protein TonB
VVYLRVAVDERGRVSAVSVIRSSGHGSLDRQAAETVRRRWRFRPARAGGAAVASEVVIPIQFALDN